MTANDDDNPHYDDLIRELRELKKFIESNGDNVIAPTARAATAAPDPARPRDGEPARTAKKAATPADADDEPPTLREAVRRPPGRDEMQLDLLSVSRFEAHEADDVDDASAIESTRRDAPAASDTDSRPPHAPDKVAPATTAESARAPSVDRADDGDPDEPVDDEVVRFVLDLSDRILGTIEDKLLEHSGELLPGEVRGELREAIGDILYEWCER